MSFGNQPADGAGNIMSSAVPDGTTTPYAVAGGPSYVDSGNTKTTVQVYLADGNNVTQGAKGDSAATNSTSSWSAIALLKGLYAKLAGTLTIGGSVSVSNFPATQPVSSTDGSQATTGTTTDAAYTSGAGTLVALLKGIFTRLAALASLGTDQSGTMLKVSVYGTNAVDGDSPFPINASGAVKTAINSVNAGVNFPIQHSNAVDSSNSSTTLLTAGATFTGTSASALSYSTLSIEVYSDQASAAGGLQILQSHDNTHFDLTDSFTVSASTPFATVIDLVGQYYQIKYVNGSTNQATFRLQTIKQVAENVMPRTLTANGNFKVAIQEDNTAGLATSANQSTANTSLSSIVTNTSNTATNTNTVAGAVSGNKMAVKAASGDFADGAIATIGTKADAADTTSSNSDTLMAFIKGVVSLLSGVLAVKRSAVAVYLLASGAQTANGNSGDLTVGLYTEIGIDINITADSGTNETIQFFWDRKGADGVYYPLWQSKTVLSTDSLAEQISTSSGAGMAYNQSLGLTGRLRWVVGGTSPSFTLSANVYGK